ncbi:hypothetical protein MN2019_04610 [Mycolicibacterium neoaurum]|uniref:hypothetical protein n=1 Tax=Mycolicibacterium neoaurum TaxID=1795 RepID=UPI001BCA93F8|nr:hypothetical protein [Mycolicibacterium neoaurum]QVI28636.1 hypothetical protein MN2019_04610 [Mycolicibacterium neoaurum]
MAIPFIGSEAVASGGLRKHELRSRFTVLYPDVYIDRDQHPTVWERAYAAWLWSGRNATIGGLTAAALHRARWVADLHQIEVFSPNRRPPAGIVTHKGQLADSEVMRRGTLPITTPERTAFDLGRRPPLDGAVIRLDALGNATGFDSADVLELLHARHSGARGARQLVKALDLYDPGAESPRETWLRLLLIRAGYPRPRTQIPVVSADGQRKYYLDMGWEELKLAAEYDGDHHRTDPVQFAKDILRSEDLDELRWRRLRVSKRHAEPDILRRMATAWNASVHTVRANRPPDDLAARSCPA